MKTNLKKLDRSQLEIEFELDEQEFQTHIDATLLHLKEHVKMDGFRQGHVPVTMVEEKVGKENLLMEAGDIAVKKSYAKFVTENNLEPIGEPEVKITKIVPIAKQSRIHDGEAIGTKEPAFIFTVKVSVLPEIELPDYKKIASQIKGNEISVDEKEIEDAIQYLQKSRAKFTDKPNGAEKKDYIKIAYENKDINGGKETRDMFILGEGGFLPDFEDNITGMKVGDEKEFSAKFPGNAPNGLAGKEGIFKVKMLAVQIMELPEINDDFAKSLGAFDSMVSLKENIKGGITLEKQESEKQRKRGEILSNISQKITFDLPEKMVEYEEQRLFEDFKDQVSQNAKIDFDEYMASIKKTEEEIKKSFKLEAEKRIKNFLVLRQIGKAEHIEVSDKELQEEVNKAIGRYSKEPLGKIDINQLKEYTKGAIFNEKIFQLLEKFSQNT